MFVRLSFNLLCYLSTSCYRYCTFQMLCWTHGIYEVCNFSEHLVGNETHTHSVLLSFKHISITLPPCPWPQDFSQKTMQLISLNCPVPHIVGPLASSRRKTILMQLCIFVHSIIYSFRPRGFCSYFKPIS